jgi:hypothetical protein
VVTIGVIIIGGLQMWKQEFKQKTHATFANYSRPMAPAALYITTLRAVFSG